MKLVFKRTFLAQPIGSEQLIRRCNLPDTGNYSDKRAMLMAGSSILGAFLTLEGFQFVPNDFISSKSTFLSYMASPMRSDAFLAFKWVKEYIEDFGGDPDAITIGSHAAGDLSPQDSC